MKKSFKNYISTALVLFLAVTITACGGGSDSPETTQTEGQATVSDTMATSANKLNINTASEEDFKTIPNVGDRMVHEFEEYRPYVSIRQFRKEIGKYVDEAQVAAYENYIYVPVSVNESDAATLQQIPGLSADEAETLIAARPFDTNQAFLESLSSYVNEDELATAKSYLKAQ
jgi:DNA uptake protein ComE-like DNA-binding protein